MTHYIYRRLHLTSKSFTPEIYIGATSNIKSRTAQHNREFPGCAVEVLIEIDCDKSQAMTLEAWAMSYYNSSNTSKMGNSGYTQTPESQAKRTKAMAGRVMEPQPVAAIIDGVHHKFQTMAACAKAINKSTAQVTEYFTRDIKFEPKLYKPNDRREDNIFRLDALSCFDF